MHGPQASPASPAGGARSQHAGRGRSQAYHRPGGGEAHGWIKAQGSSCTGAGGRAWRGRGPAAVVGARVANVGARMMMIKLHKRCMLWSVAACSALLGCARVGLCLNPALAGLCVPVRACRPPNPKPCPKPCFATPLALSWVRGWRAARVEARLLSRQQSASSWGRGQACLHSIAYPGDYQSCCTPVPYHRTPTTLHSALSPAPCLGDPHRAAGLPFGRRPSFHCSRQASFGRDPAGVAAPRPRRRRVATITPVPAHASRCGPCMLAQPR